MEWIINKALSHDIDQKLQNNRQEILEIQFHDEGIDDYPTFTLDKDVIVKIKGHYALSIKI